jgi:hypothetical protein
MGLRKGRTRLTFFMKESAAREYQNRGSQYQDLKSGKDFF